jgi:hypothetical protein
MGNVQQVCHKVLELPTANSLFLCFSIYLCDI